jgi:hypothetical protein
VFFWAQPRFRYPLDLPLAILASVALLQVRHFLRRTGTAPSTQR